MNIKQLLLISALCTFSAQAMEETKVAQEESKELKESKISQICPNSVNFLIKILGPQKDIKSKEQSEVTKKGLPEDLIYRIIDEYLKIYLYKYPSNHEIELSSNFDEMLKKVINRNYRNSYLDTFNYVTSLRIIRSQFNGSNRSFRIEYHLDNIEDTMHMDFFEASDKFVLDINTADEGQLQNINIADDPYLRLPYKISSLISWIKDNKFKSLAAISTMVGAFGYMANKLRK